MKSAKLEYYEYIEDTKFYCCSMIVSSKLKINYEYNPHKQELRVKRFKNNKEVACKTIYNIKPTVSRCVINADMFIKAGKLKIDTDDIRGEGQTVRDFLYKKFNYIRCFEEIDKKIRDSVVNYFNDSPVSGDPDSNDFGIVVDLINCGGIKC